MPKSKTLLALILCFTVTGAAHAATGPVTYKVIYSGGSLPAVKGGEAMRLQLNSASLTLWFKKEGIIAIPAAAITEVSYGQEVHRRVGTAIGLAVVSFGIGAMMLLAKSKKHYIGLTWDDEGKKGGAALQADKNEYRGLIMALEGISGKKAVNTDPPAK